MISELRVLIVGDAVGKPGRDAIAKVVPEYRKSGKAHFVIANGENSAHGKGITQDTARQLYAAGVDVITAGNHTWDNKDVFKLVENETRFVRPANLGVNPDVPGQGSGVFPVEGMDGIEVGIFNLLGRVHMACVHCPFQYADTALADLSGRTPIVFLDFHAEATSEKIAMGWQLDGKVTCVFGTHTHVQTSDNRVLPGGTAYITDVGMTGGHEGVIGVKLAQVLHRYRTNMPVRHEVAEGDVQLCGVLVTVDTSTGRALAIERVREALD